MLDGKLFHEINQYIDAVIHNGDVQYRINSKVIPCLFGATLFMSQYTVCTTFVVSLWRRGFNLVNERDIKMFLASGNTNLNEKKLDEAFERGKRLHNVQQDLLRHMGELEYWKKHSEDDYYYALVGAVILNDLKDPNLDDYMAYLKDYALMPSIFENICNDLELLKEV